jgi:hypothetical protein
MLMYQICFWLISYILKQSKHKISAGAHSLVKLM